MHSTSAGPNAPEAPDSVLVAGGAIISRGGSGWAVSCAGMAQRFKHHSIASAMGAGMTSPASYVRARAPLPTMMCLSSRMCIFMWLRRYRDPINARHGPMLEIQVFSA